MSNKQVNAPTHVQGIDAIEPKSEEADNLVNIKVVSATSGIETSMQVKKDYQLIDLQKDFGPTTARDESTPRLLYCGERITEHDTPESLDMEDGDTIDIVYEQYGGF